MKMIKEYWVIIVFAVGLIGQTATAQLQIAENKDDIKDLKKDKEQTIRMEERQKNMKDDLNEMKKLQQDILKELRKG